MTVFSTEIQLRRLRFYAHHGVLPQEQRVGAWFTLSLSCKIKPHAIATEGDNLSGTVSYAEIYAMLRQEMAQPAQLLEHLATRILSRLFETFPLIEAANIEIQKDCPPIEGFEGEGCAVCLQAQR